MCINSIDILNCDYFKQNAINVNIQQSNVIEDIFLCFDFIFELYKKSEKTI